MDAFRRFRFFFFNDPATTDIYPLPLPDALPISSTRSVRRDPPRRRRARRGAARGRSSRARPPRATAARSRRAARFPPQAAARFPPRAAARFPRSEEHTSELQSLAYLVCRLLLEK